MIFSKFGLLILIIFFITHASNAVLPHEQSIEISRFVGGPQPTEGSIGATTKSGTISRVSDLSGVSLIKYVKNKEEYNKADKITIRLEIVNMNLDNKITDIQITEELPESVNFINSYPNPSKDINSNIEWRLDRINAISIIEFNISVNNTGKCVLNPTLLTATKTDINGRVSDIISLSNLAYLSAINRPPEFKSINFPESPAWQGDNNLNVSLDISDCDNDEINCKLWSSLDGFIYGESIPNSAKNGCKSFNWDLKKCCPGKHTFTLIANDETHEIERTAELEIIDYIGLGPLKIRSEYVSTIFIAALLAGIFEAAAGDIFRRISTRKVRTVLRQIFSKSRNYKSKRNNLKKDHDEDESIEK